MEKIEEGYTVREFYNSIISVIGDSEFSSNENNADHLKYILDKLFERKTMESEVISDVNMKCSKISENLRLKVNEYLISDENPSLDDSLEEMTKSVAWAPVGSQELSLSYADRSEILFRARLISDCLIDIERALENNLPEDMKSKLYLRKAICFRILEPENYSKFEMTLAEARKWSEKMNEENKILMLEMIKEQENIKSIDRSKFFKWNAEKFLPKLKSDNLMIPGLSDALELRYSEKFGRHIVATRNIKPGEILVMQKPFIRVINTQMRYKFCWNCAEQTWAGVPCDSCSEIVYCSENCKEEGKILHHAFECPIIWAMISLEMNDGLFVSLRLTNMALKETGNSLEILKNNLQKIDSSEEPLTKGFTNNILDPGKFASVYGLVTHPALLIPSECSFVADSIFIAYFLATKTKFFAKELGGTLNELKDNMLFIFLIELIERNMQISNYNSFSVEGNTRIQKFRMIVPASSFFNHSCNQMIIRRIHGDYLTSTALCSIKKGEQIFDNYGVYYDEMSKKERQEELFELYRFNCDCEACNNDWPMYSIETDLSKKHFYGFTKMTLKYREIFKKYLIVKRICNSFGRKYNHIPDVSEDIADIVKIIETFCRHFDKNSVEIVDSVLMLDSLLSISENRYLSLN